MLIGFITEQNFEVRYDETIGLVDVLRVIVACDSVYHTYHHKDPAEEFRCKLLAVIYVQNEYSSAL